MSSIMPGQATVLLHSDYPFSLVVVGSAGPSEACCLVKAWFCYCSHPCAALLVVTAAVAEVCLSIPISSMGNPWWIMMDAKFMEGHLGEQRKDPHRSWVTP